MRVANVKDGWLDLTDVYSIDATDAEIEKCSLQFGDILLTEGGDADKLGRGTFWEAQLPECVHQNHIFRVRLPADKFCHEYVAFQFGSPYGKAYFAAHAKQTTGIATINRRVLGRFPLLVPPLGEQRRIAARLREELVEVAESRAAVEAQLESLQLVPTALLRHIFQSPEAQHWPRKRFGDMCTIDAGQVDPKLPEYKNLPHVNGENIESGTCRLVNVKTAEEDGMTSGKYLFESGVVLYSKLRPYLRKVAVAPFRGLCSADMYPLRVTHDVLDAGFTGWLLLSSEFTEYAIGESQRSRMPKLNRDQLFSWQTPIPTLARQRELAQRIDEEMASVSDLKLTLTERLDCINKLPASILGSAFHVHDGLA